METTDTRAPQCAVATINGRIITVQAPPALSASDYLQPLDQIQTPAQIPPGVVISSTANTNLRLNAPSPFGFDFHFINEAVRGVLQGTTGLRIDAAVDAVIAASLTGSYTAALQRDDVDGEPWLRLSLNQAAESALQSSVKATITANVDTVLPTSSDELLHAILGVHPLQWLRSSISEIGSVRWTRVAEACGAPSATLEYVLDTLQKLTARSESVLWKAATQPTALAELLSWSYWIANDCANLATLRDRIQTALDQDPAFATTIAAQWLESASGADLVHLTTQSAWEQLRETCTLLDRRTNLDKLTVDATGLLTLLLRLPGLAAQELDQTNPGEWLLQRLQQVLRRGSAKLPLLDRVAAWLPLRDRIYTAAKDALAQRLPAELSILLESSHGGTALADASFRMTPAGLNRLHQVLNGDLTVLYGPPDPEIRLRHGALTHHLRRTRHIELHLPFVERRGWEDSLEALASAEVLCDSNGRLITWTTQAHDLHRLSNNCHSTMIFAAAFSSRDAGPINDNFTLTFEDTRMVSAGGHNEAWFQVLAAYGLPRPELPEKPVKATLSLALPGRFAQFWAIAPHSRSAEYSPAMCRVGRALQASMRYWLPSLHFAGLDHYRTPSAAYPLLAYQNSVPFTDVKRGQFCYDFMSRESIARALNSAAPKLRQTLPELQRALASAGLEDLASSYDPKYIARNLSQVQIQQRNFQSLIAADAQFIESMVHLADTTTELRNMCARKPLTAIRNLSRYSADLVRALHGRLRRLYAGNDFVVLGSLLLVEATSALAGGMEGSMPIAATLQLEQNGGRQIYTNAAAGNQL
ncbi:hypothetical protein [uncultured Paludibaculum sp.]|uniref:hypothetical protein n=1 Tax=uncultured Paludibaculum sp. TaxID=1765020 RepID=UPI002AAB78A9|nr:hypothetical protein [uncultured Paludibaculum sp.]